MRIVVPVVTEDTQAAHVVGIEERKFFLLLELEGLTIKKSSKLDNMEEMFELDYLIVLPDEQAHKEYMEEYDIRVLCVLNRFNSSIESVVEGILFSELDELM